MKLKHPKYVFVRTKSFPYKKGDLVKFDRGGEEFKVVRLYRDNWFKKFLRDKLKIKLRFNQYKIKIK